MRFAAQIMTTITLFAAPAAKQLLQQRSFPPTANMRDCIQHMATSSNVPLPGSFLFSTTRVTQST